MHLSAITYTTLAILVVTIWVFGHFIYNAYFHPLRRIPGPFLAKITRLWLFSLEIRGTPHQEILKLHRQYGPIMRIAPDEVSFNDVGATSVIYAQMSQFEKATYFYRAFEAQAANIFTMRDRRSHSQDKKLISHAMSRSNITLHESSIYDKGVFLMDRVAQRAQSNLKIPLYSAFRCMTLDTISDFAFGKPTGALQLENFESATFDAIEKSNNAIIYFQNFPFVHRVARWVTEYGIDIVPTGFVDLIRAAEAGFDDMFTVDSWTMFKSIIAAAEKSTKLTKEHLVSEGMVMIVAGTDTTATSLSVTIHQLLQQPETYKKLQDEIRAVMPEVDSRPSINDLDKLPLLDACIKEGMRISSPVPTRLPRVVPPGGWTFGGYYFPAGVHVSSSPLYLHNNEDVFPRPETFNPSRWLVEGEQKSKMMSYFHPFSQGSRQCIGQNLSLIEQKIVLALFVRHFDPKEVLEKTIKFKESITAYPDHPMDVLLDMAG